MNNCDLQEKVEYFTLIRFQDKIREYYRTLIQCHKLPGTDPSTSLSRLLGDCLSARGGVQLYLEDGASTEAVHRLVTVH